MLFISSPFRTGLVQNCNHLISLVLVTESREMEGKVNEVDGKIGYEGDEI